MHLYNTPTAQRRQQGGRQGHRADYTSVLVLLGVLAALVVAFWGISSVFYLVTRDDSASELSVQPSGTPMPELTNIPVLPGATGIVRDTTSDRFDRPVYHLAYDTGKSIAEVSTYYEKVLPELGWYSSKAEGAYSKITDSIFGQNYFAGAGNRHGGVIFYGVAVKATSRGGVTHVLVQYGYGGQLFAR